MLSRFLSWLGFEPAARPTRGPRRPQKPGSATAHLFEKRPTQAQRKAHPAATDKSDFNPYNTGKFDRSASWERISKR